MIWVCLNCYEKEDISYIEIGDVNDWLIEANVPGSMYANLLF